MKTPRPPLFVAPRIYRLRRLRDAARMLPAFGAVLMILPFLHSPAEGGRSLAADGIYLFGIWALLILIARQLAPELDPELDPEFDPDRDAEHPDTTDVPGA